MFSTFQLLAAKMSISQSRRNKKCGPAGVHYSPQTPEATKSLFCWVWLYYIFLCFFLVAGLHWEAEDCNEHLQDHIFVSPGLINGKDLCSFSPFWWHLGDTHQLKQRSSLQTSRTLKVRGQSHQAANFPSTMQKKKMKCGQMMRLYVPSILKQFKL